MTTEMQFDREKAEKFLETLKLGHGSHEAPEKGFCVMEAVAYVAGEPHADHPKCASRVLTEFCIRLNDRWDEERRQKLKPYVLRLVGTAADDATERKRAFMCADWAVRECLPMALEAAKIKDWPEKLRALAPIADKASAEVGRAAAREARKAADAAAYAYATYAAYAAADAAAYAYATYAAAAAADAAAKVSWQKADASALALLDRLIAVKPGPFA